MIRFNHTSRKTLARRRIGLCALLAILALTAIGCAKKPPAELLKEAEQAARRGDTLGAILSCKKIIKTAPDQPVANEARMLMAACNAQNGEVEAARENLNEVIEKTGLDTPAGQQAFTNLIYTYSMGNDLPGAIAEIEKTLPKLAKSPEFEQETRIMLANLYVASKQIEKGRAMLDEMRDKAANEDAALKIGEQIVRIAMREGKPEDALAVYEAYMLKYPESNHKPLVLFGMGFFNNRMAEKATDAKDEAGAKAYAEKAAKLLNESLQTLQKQADAEPVPGRKAGLLDQISKIMIELKRDDEAVKMLLDFADANRELQQRPNIMRNAAEIRLMRGKYDEGRKIIERMVTEFANTPVAEQAQQYLNAIDQQLAQQKQAAQMKQLAADALTTGSAAATTATQAAPPAVK